MFVLVYDSLLLSMNNKKVSNASIYEIFRLSWFPSYCPPYFGTKHMMI